MKKVLLFLVLTINSCNIKPTDADSIVDIETVDTVLTTSTKMEIKKDDAKVKQLAQFFNLKKDEFEGTRWITPKSAPIYRNSNGIYCYFSSDNESANNFRFVLQYKSEDWLFIRNAKFLIDGEVFDYTPEEVKRDNGDGGIWEWWDQSVKKSDVTMLKKIGESKSAKVKLSGEQYYNVVVITDKQKLNIKRALEYYEALGGTFEH